MKAPSSSVPPQPSISASQDQPQTAEPPVLHIDWSGWLETVRALPSEDTDWEGIPQFLETLQQLYEKNQQEREERNTQRRRLQEALSALEIPDFFEIDASQWTVETCLPDHITTALQLSEQLRALLPKHDEHHKPSGLSLSEERVRRQKVERLEEEILGICERLAESLTPSPEQPSQQGGEEHQAEAEPPITSSETLDTPPLLTQPQEALSQEAPTPSLQTDLQADKPDQSLAVSAIPESAPEEPTLPAPQLPPQPERPPVQAAQEPIASKEETPKLAQGERYEEDNKIVSSSPQTDESLSTEVPAHDPPPSNLGPEQSAQREASDPPAFVPPEVSDSDILLPGGRNSDIQKKAFHLQTTSDPEEWTNLLWALVAEDALPTAYWLTRSLPAMNQPCPVPDWLLAAVQATRWLQPNSETFVDDLTDVVQNAQSFNDEPQKLLGLSAALRATLLAPRTGIQTWLSTPESCPNLGKIIEAVKTFANWGRPLRPDDLLGVTDVEQCRESCRGAAQKVQVWLEGAPQRRATLRRASAVWLNMTSQRGLLQTFLHPVVEDDQTKLDEVHKNLEQWQNRNYITSRIDEIDQELAGKKYRRIDGKVRNRIVQDVQEACGLVRRWCECVEREQEIQSGKDPFFGMMNEVRSQIQEILPEVIQTLQELSRPTQPRPIGAAAQCLLRSVKQLQDMLTGQSRPQTRQQEWFTGNTDSLSTALSRLLLWLPEILQEDAGQIDETAQPQIGPTLCKAIAEGRSLQSAFGTWLANHDYRFTETILAAFDEADYPAKCQEYQEALEGAREGLRTAVSKTRAAIERAEADGISTEERSEHEGIIESLDPDETLYFPPKHGQLKQIDTQLQEARRVRQQEVQTHWDDLQPQLAKRIDSSTWERIRSFVQSNLDSRATRVVEECIAHLAEVVEEGRGLEEDLFSRPHSRDVLQEFLDALPQIQDSLSRMGGLRQFGKNITRGSSVAGINFGETPTRRRDEAAQAIKAWQDLKKQGRANGSSISESVTTLLNYLGFSLESVPSVRTVQQGTDWVYIRAQMSASGLAKPIPQFGSHTHGHYDIVCVGTARR